MTDLGLLACVPVIMFLTITGARAALRLALDPKREQWWVVPAALTAAFTVAGLGVWAVMQILTTVTAEPWVDLQ